MRATVGSLHTGNTIRYFVQDLIELPVSAAEAPVDETCWINEIEITNNSTEDIVITVKDRKATPSIKILQSLPPGGVLSSDSRIGHRMVGGFTWQASAAGVNGYVFGYIGHEPRGLL